MASSKLTCNSHQQTTLINPCYHHRKKHVAANLCILQTCKYVSTVQRRSEHPVLHTSSHLHSYKHYITVPRPQTLTFFKL